MLLHALVPLVQEGKPGTSVNIRSNIVTQNTGQPPPQYSFSPVLVSLSFLAGFYGGTR